MDRKQNSPSVKTPSKSPYLHHACTPASATARSPGTTAAAKAAVKAAYSPMPNRLPATSASSTTGGTVTSPPSSAKKKPSTTAGTPTSSHHHAGSSSSSSATASASASAASSHKGASARTPDTSKSNVTPRYHYGLHSAAKDEEEGMLKVGKSLNELDQALAALSPFRYGGSSFNDEENESSSDDDSDRDDDENDRNNDYGNEYRDDYNNNNNSSDNNNGSYNEDGDNNNHQSEAVNEKPAVGLFFGHGYEQQQQQQQQSDQQQEHQEDLDYRQPESQQTYFYQVTAANDSLPVVLPPQQQQQFHQTRDEVQYESSISQQRQYRDEDVDEFVERKSRHNGDANQQQQQQQPNAVNSSSASARHKRKEQRAKRYHGEESSSSSSSTSSSSSSSNSSDSNSSDDSDDSSDDSSSSSSDSDRRHRRHGRKGDKKRKDHKKKKDKSRKSKQQSSTLGGRSSGGFGFNSDANNLTSGTESAGDFPYGSSSAAVAAAIAPLVSLSLRKTAEPPEDPTVFETNRLLTERIHEQEAQLAVFQRRLQSFELGSPQQRRYGGPEMYSTVSFDHSAAAASAGGQDRVAALEGAVEERDKMIHQLSDALESQLRHAAESGATGGSPVSLAAGSSSETANDVRERLAKLQQELKLRDMRGAVLVRQADSAGLGENKSAAEQRALEAEAVGRDREVMVKQLMMENERLKLANDRLMEMMERGLGTDTDSVSLMKELMSSQVRIKELEMHNTVLAEALRQATEKEAELRRDLAHAAARANDAEALVTVLSAEGGASSEIPSHLSPPHGVIHEDIISRLSRSSPPSVVGDNLASRFAAAGSLSARSNASSLDGGGASSAGGMQSLWRKVDAWNRVLQEQQMELEALKQDVGDVANSPPSQLKQRLSSGSDGGENKIDRATLLSQTEARIRKEAEARVASAAANRSQQKPADLDSNPMGVEVGDYVRTGKCEGTVRFVGNTSFKEGLWIGVELVRPFGRTDGSVYNVRYFTCEPQFGVFLRSSEILEIIRKRSAAS